MDTSRNLAALLQAMNALRVSLLLILAAVAHTGSAWALDPSREISQYAHTAWTVQDGYLPGRALDIGQTTDGYLWIGTEAGLLRFDGVRFDASSPPVQRQPALSSERIENLFGASDGSLLISAHPGRGRSSLSRWTGSKLLNYPVAGEMIGDLYQSSGGNLWLAGPLCQILGSQLRCYGNGDGIPQQTYHLAEDGPGHFLVTSQTDVFRWSPGTRAVSVYSSRALRQIAIGVISGIVKAPDGSLWLGTSEPGPGMGLEHLVHGRWTSTIAPGLDSSKWLVSDLFLDRHGALWVGTLQRGVYRIYGHAIDHFGRADGLSSDTVEDIFEDREGDIWVATDGGIDRFRDTTVEAFSPLTGFCLVESDSLLVTHDGTLWVGGDGALALRRGNRFVCLPLGKRIPGQQVTSLFEDDAHQLWIGVDDKLGIYEHGHFTQVHGADGKSLGMIVAVAEDADHNIWMISGGHHRALFRIRDRKVEQELTFPALPAAPHAVAVDPTGGIWLGLMNGDLARYRNGHLQLVHFHRPTGTFVMQLAVRPDGSVLAASGSGLLGWKEGKLHIMTTRNGLPCDATNAFLSDDSGSLWLYLQCGFVEIPAVQLQKWWTDPRAVLQLRVLGALDGMQAAGAGWFQSLSAKTPDGRLWFGGDVLQMIDPGQRQENPATPLVRVEQLHADQKQYTLGRALELPALTRYIEIDYTAPILAIPQRVRFRYRLEGLDRDWQDAGTRREALYTNLGPGHYTFRVAASSSGGPWSTNDASVGFMIAPAFYQTRWFYVLCGLACLALLTVAYRARVRQVAAQVSGRMEARLAERERIARDLHDTLLQGMQGLIWRFQAATDRIPAEQPARELMEQSLNRADKLLEEGRDKIKELRPRAGTVTDLAQSLAVEGEQLAQHQPVEFRVSVEGAPRDLHPIVREEAFLIGREALNNAFRHSGAKEVEVELTYGEAVLHIRVRDDGRGIGKAMLEAGGCPQHFGLVGMRERAKKLGGNLDIWSKPGAGTEIDFRVPADVAYGRNALPSMRARSWLGIFSPFSRPPG